MFFMQNYKKSAKISLIITYVFMLLLVVLTIGLPYGITWYVEVKGRAPDLAATVMLTCYPCVPFAAVALFRLRRFLKNLIRDTLFEGKNLYDLIYIAFCCLFSGIIMLIAGFFYMPFYISGGAAMFCALIVKVIYDALLSFKKEDNNL